MWSPEVDEPAISLFVLFCGFSDGDHFEFVDFEKCLSRRMEPNGIKKCSLLRNGHLDVDLAKDACKREAASLDMAHLCDYQLWIYIVVVPFFRILTRR